MDIKKAVEKQLVELLKDEAEPSEGRMKLLKLGIAYLAVNAKLEENEYGDFFAADEQPGDASSVSLGTNGEKPAARRGKKRGNGADTPEAGQSGGEGT